MLGAPNERTDTRDALIREGIRVWSERGWSAVGVQELLASLCVPKGSFYHYFESKESFGLEIIDAYAKRISQRFGESILAEGNAQARISRFIAAARDSLQRVGFRRGCLVGNLSQELGGSDGRLRAALDQVWRSWEKAIAACLREGVAQGAWPTTLDIETAARIFWVGWEGALLRAKLARAGGALDDFERSFLAMLAAGIPTRRRRLVPSRS
jgi:TetR/AcrR family transcriptional repressor of nem operon